MKKSSVIFVMICLIGLWLVSCVKENDGINTKVKQIDKSATAQLLKRLKTNSYAGTYLLAAKIGHKSTDCSGKCKYIGGEWRHIDCQGNGSECSLRVSVYISKAIPDDTTDIYYTATGVNDYEPIEESDFSMPARSFYIEDENLENGFIWMNIPEQVLQRDEASNQFVYKDITFTAEPLFENL